MTCPEGMTPRLLGGRKLCLNWSPGRFRCEVWEHDETQLVLLGLLKRRHAGGWDAQQPGGRMAGMPDLGWALSWLMTTPLVE